MSYALLSIHAEPCLSSDRTRALFYCEILDVDHACAGFVLIELHLSRGTIERVDSPAFHGPEIEGFARHSAVRDELVSIARASGLCS